MSTIETLTSLDARAQRGLGGDEAKARLRGQGANEVPERRRSPLIALSLVLHKYADVYVAFSLLIVKQARIRSVLFWRCSPGSPEDREARCTPCRTSVTRMWRLL
jgi:hypothetical protein